MTSRSKKILIVLLSVVIGLPVVLILTTIVTVNALDRSNGTITVGGELREYLLYVPRSYDPATPTALVVSMHGAAVWPAHQMNTSRWNLLADEYGFLVAFPSASGSPKAWHVDMGPGLEKDVAYIAALIDTIEASYNIDPARIYADGLSNGGGMAFVLSCTMSDRIAAVGMVAAALSLPWSWCTDDRPVPMIAFHGTADPIVPYHGGTSPIAPPTTLFPDIPSWTTNWARRNHCDSEAQEIGVASDVTRIEYQNCEDDASVVLYTMIEGGHTWPGGKPLPEWFVGPTSNSVNATRQTWMFFDQH